MLVTLFAQHISHSHPKSLESYENQYEKLKKIGLGVIDKSEIAQKLGQNGILQAFLKNLFESTWPSEVILLKRKFRFISQKPKLESNVET